MTSIPLKLINGKTVGKIEGDSAVLPVGSRNYFAAKRGYSVDAGVLNAVRESGCLWLIFFNKKKNRRLRISFDDFIEHASRLDYGHGIKLVAPDFLYEDLDGPIPAQATPDPGQSPTGGYEQGELFR